MHAKFQTLACSVVREFRSKQLKWFWSRFRRRSRPWQRKAQIVWRGAPPIAKQGWQTRVGRRMRGNRERCSGPRRVSSVCFVFIIVAGRKRCFSKQLQPASVEGMQMKDPIVHMYHHVQRHHKSERIKVQVLACSAKKPRCHDEPTSLSASSSATIHSLALGSYPRHRAPGLQPTKDNPPMNPFRAELAPEYIN